MHYIQFMKTISISKVFSSTQFMSIYLSIKIDISDIFAVYMILSIFLQYLQGHCFSSYIVYTTYYCSFDGIICYSASRKLYRPFSLNQVFDILMGMENAKCKIKPEDCLQKIAYIKIGNMYIIVSKHTTSHCTVQSAYFRQILLELEWYIFSEPE